MITGVNSGLAQAGWQVDIMNHDCSGGDMTVSSSGPIDGSSNSNDCVIDGVTYTYTDEVVLRRQNITDFHIRINQLTDPNQDPTQTVNTLTATGARTKSIVNAPSDYQSSLGNVSDFKDVAFRFGVRIGSYSKSYSVRYYLEKVKLDQVWSYIYRKRLYYGKGYVDLPPSVGDQINIDLYGDFDAAGNGSYVLTLNGVNIECGEMSNADQPEIESFVSTYGRPNDGNASFFHQLGSLADVLPDCPADPCASYDTELRYPIGHDTPTCGITRKTSCITNVLAPWDPFAPWGGGNRETPSDGEVTEIFVYPNPTKDIINVALNTPDIESIELQIVNSTGELVHQKVTQTDKGTNLILIDITALPSGIYYIKTNSKYEFETQKFTVIK